MRKINVKKRGSWNGRARRRNVIKKRRLIGQRIKKKPHRTRIRQVRQSVIKILASAPKILPSAPMKKSKKLIKSRQMTGIKSANLPRGVIGMRLQTGPGPGISCAPAKDQNRLRPAAKKATSLGPGRPWVGGQDTTIGGLQAPVVAAHRAVSV
jgi:hypothetical protein